MRRLINRLVPVLFVLVTLLFAAYVAWDHLRGENTPPQLTCESDTLEASIHDGDEVLLAGVRATDAEDGDLTAQVLVESVSRFVEQGVCRVTYAVQDSGNAVAKLTRTLHYTDYTPPQFSLTAPLVFDYGKSFDPADYVRVTDCVDGDISDTVRMTLMEEASSISGVGDWQVRFRATNSMGETVYLTTKVTVRNLSSTEKRYSPTIRLSQYLVYVPVGGTFNPLDYLQDVSVAAEDAAADNAALRERLRTTSNVDTSTAGTYTVTYTCSTVTGYSGSVDLIVVVGDTPA